MTIKEIALLAPIFISLVTGLNLLFYNWKENYSKILLSVFLLLTAIFYVLITLYQTGNFQIYQYFDGAFLSLMLVFHPMFYLYVKSLIKGEKITGSHFFHFIPAFVILILSYLLYGFLDETSRIYYLSQYMNGKTIANPIMIKIHILFQIEKMILLVQAIVYYILALRLILKHREEIDNFFSDTSGFRLNWLLICNILILLPTFASIAVNYIPTPILNNDNRYIIILFFIFTFFYGTIGILGAHQRRIFPVSLEVDSYKQYPKEKSFNLKFKNELLSYFEQEKPFLDPNLDIWDLCKKLNTNRTYISTLINNAFGINFATFVNQYRVLEIKKLLEEKRSQPHSMDAISQAAGFNSVVSMNRWFKKITATTPSNYRDALLENEKEINN